jgi:6-phosphofructokinase
VAKLVQHASTSAATCDDNLPSTPKSSEDFQKKKFLEDDMEMLVAIGGDGRWSVAQKLRKGSKFLVLHVRTLDVNPNTDGKMATGF